ATTIILVYRSYGGEVLWKGAIMLVGLGFLIFVHELGHFLAAKWCDVHVQTFSIGFGPALPGCTFRRGETTYKLAVFPLGGYVNMGAKDSREMKTRIIRVRSRTRRSASGC